VKVANRPLRRRFDNELKKNEILIGNEELAKELVAEAEQQTFVVNEVTKKERKRNPVPPFITSKLQQEASRKLSFPVKRTMMIAQHLYEVSRLRRRLSRSDYLHAN